MKEMDHPALIQERKISLDTASYQKKIDKKEKPPPKKKVIDRNDSQGFWPKFIIEDMKWFPFQGIMPHTSGNIECPA